MTDAQTLAVYDEKAEDYARIIGSGDKPLASLHAFMADLPEGGDVLDLGCGPGTWARHLVEAGFCVDAIDASFGMVKTASTIAGLTVWQAEFSDVTEENRYDGIWANFSLLHLPRAELPGVLERLSLALRPGGILHIGLKQGQGEARDSLGRFYTYYTIEEISGLLARLGLSVRDVRTGADKGLDGTVAPWFTLTAHG